MSIIPNEENVKQGQSGHDMKKDVDSSSDYVEPQNSGEEPRLRADAHAPATVATQSNSAQAGNPEQVGSVVSQMPIASEPLPPDTRTSRQDQSGAAMSPSLLPMLLPDVVSEASQTLDPPAILHRSLTLQYSPSKTHHASTPGLQFTDAFVGSPSSQRETSMTLPSHETQVPTSWSTFSLSNLLSVNSPVRRHAPQRDNLNSAGNVSQDATTSATTFQQARETPPPKRVDSEESRTQLVPWCQSPRMLDRRRGTPQAIEDPPSSPVTCSSPTLDFEGERASSEASENEETVAEPCIPYVTLFVTMLQLRAHWNSLHKYYPERCASISTIVEEGLWERVLFAAFHHENVIHLVFNLMFFFISGFVLEAAVGPWYFGIIFTALVALVGSVHTLLMLVIYERTLEPYLAASCAHTFAGVTIAADILTRAHCEGLNIRYGIYEFEYTSGWVLLGEMFVLYGVYTDNLLPMASGLLVGAFLVKTKVGRFFIRVTSQRSHVNLYVFPNAPITFLLCASIIVAHMYGPYLNHSHTAQPGLTFQYPVWQPPILPALYLPSSFLIFYVINCLWKVCPKLEQDFGHLSFLRMLICLLLGVNMMIDVVTWATWTHTIALRTGQPVPAAHSSSCGCGLVGVLLALKIIHHDRRDARHVPKTWFSVPFWADVGLNLAFFSWMMPAGSSVANVIGVLLGLVVINAKSENFPNCIPEPGSASARSSPRGSRDVEPGALRSGLTGIRHCLLGC
ncbi:hypothetical protein MRX96_004222 [Rhipicephalus microplus]